MDGTNAMMIYIFDSRSSPFVLVLDEYMSGSTAINPLHLEFVGWIQQQYEIDRWSRTARSLIQVSSPRQTMYILSKPRLGHTIDTGTMIARSCRQF